MSTALLPARLPASLQIGGWVRNLFGYTIPRRALALFFDALAVLLNAGQSLPQAVRRAAGGGDPELRGIGEVVAPLLERGVSVTAALRPYAHRFPEIVLPVLEAGEESGSLAGASRRLADGFQGGLAVERRFRYAVFDPWLVIVTLALLRALRTLGMPLTETIRVVLGNLLTLVACYLGGRLLVRGAMRWAGLRLAVDTVLCALPHVGAVVRNLAAARWARSFAVLWRAGVPISTALEVSSRSALNAHYTRALRRAARQTRHGATLAQSLAATQLLPAHLLSVITTGETAGDLADVLERLATALEEEAFTRASQEMMTAVVAGEVLLAVLAITAGLH